MLLLTWGASSLLAMLAQRVMQRSGLRNSLRKRLSRFISIGVWIVGILLSAMILFPGLTPTKAIGAMEIASLAVGLANKVILGRVANVAMRMILIRLLSGELNVSTNSFLFKNTHRQMQKIQLV